MLTANAVRSMVRGSEIKEPLTVEISSSNYSSGGGSRNADQQEVVTVSDGTDHVKAIVLAPDYNSKVYNRGNIVVTAKVTGFISSGGNAYGSGEPIVCLASLQVIQAVERRRNNNRQTRSTNSNNNNTNTPSFQMPAGRVQGGTTPAFLSQTAPFLTNRQLAGCEAHNLNSDSEAKSTMMASKWRDVQQFLSQHAAMKTLHKNHHQPTNNNDNDTNDNNENNTAESSAGTNASSSSPAATTQVYMSVLNEFQASQLDRQKATLTSNAGRESAAVSTQIVNQHQAALSLALQQQVEGSNNNNDDNDDLTVERLKTHHGMICGNGLLPDAGQLRTKSVRVGLTTFCPHERVPASLQQFCQAIKILDARLVQHCQQQNNNNDEKAVSAVTFAAAVFLGIVDIHAFSDGNGRLARIAANWALHKAGFPFCVGLHATPSQRSEYSRAILQTRKNLDLIARGNVPEDVLVTAFHKVGALRPIVNLMLDRIHKAITEFNKLLTEKQSLHCEEAEARAARKFRERAATGTCLICFESQPNIATLCCGKAVHLNCMAEWLSAKNSCPNCRSALPSIPERMRAPAASAAAGEEDTTTTLDDADLSGFESDLSTTEEQDDNDDTTMVDDDTTTTTSERHDEPPPAAAADQQQQHVQDFDTTTTDDDTISEAPETAAQNNNNNNDDNDNDTTISDDNDTMDDDDTTTTVAPPAPAPPAVLYCELCSNRAARDCDNSMCGRCCVIRGFYRCDRHA